jgi:hypothetical protein
MSLWNLIDGASFSHRLAWSDPTPSREDLALAHVGLAVAGSTMVDPAQMPVDLALERMNLAPGGSGPSATVSGGGGLHHGG